LAEEKAQPALGVMPNLPMRCSVAEPPVRLDRSLCALYVFVTVF
jgi:hypothetical protein